MLVSLMVVLLGFEREVVSRKDSDEQSAGCCGLLGRYFVLVFRWSTELWADCLAVIFGANFVMTCILMMLLLPLELLVVVPATVYLAVITGGFQADVPAAALIVTLVVCVAVVILVTAIGLSVTIGVLFNTIHTTFVLDVVAAGDLEGGPREEQGAIEQVSESQPA